MSNEALTFIQIFLAFTITVVAYRLFGKIGLFVMALGVSVSKTSDLGVSPVNSIPCVLSVITNIDMGICTTVVFVSFILDMNYLFLFDIIRSVKYCQSFYNIFLKWRFIL